MIAFHVPIKPISVNHCYGQNPYGGRYLKPAAKAFKNAIGMIALNIKSSMDMETYKKWDRAFSTGKFELEIFYNFSSIKNDVDNSNKLVQDALEGVIYKNDNQVFKITSTKSVVKTKEPHFDILVNIIGSLEEKLKR